MHDTFPGEELFYLQCGSQGCDRPVPAYPEDLRMAIAGTVATVTLNMTPAEGKERVSLCDRSDCGARCAAVEVRNPETVLRLQAEIPPDQVTVFDELDLTLKSLDSL